MKPSSKETQIGTPSLPSNLTFTELAYMTKRGFLAKKLGHYLGLHTDEGDSLFFLSLSKSSFANPNKENQSEFILYLSEQLLKWSDQNQDVPQQIKSLDIRVDIQNAMLKAYEIYKSDLFNIPAEKEKTVSTNLTSNDKWEVYRDVIFAVTQGKFLLIKKEEVNKYKEGIVLCEGTIKNRSDIPICRTLARESLELEGFNKTTIMSWLLVLSEAITNIVKHAEEGKMTLIKDEKNQEIRFVIEDKGPGFALKNLPKMTLLAGYSTKNSLGQGFTLMMKMAKTISLFTSSEGSIIILIFDLKKENTTK